MSGLSVPPVPPVGAARPPRVRGLMRSLGLSATGMKAQQRVLDTISENIQNAGTTRSADGGPYRRKVAVLERDADGGVRVARVVEDPGPGHSVHQPGHPDADAEGMVEYPNVDVITEMTDMMIARRVYEANATAFQAAKAMVRRALEI